MNGNTSIFSRLVVVLFSAGALAYAGEPFAIDWHTIDAGGIMLSDDGQPGGFELSSTIGQPVRRGCTPHRRGLRRGQHLGDQQCERQRDRALAAQSDFCGQGYCRDSAGAGGHEECLFERI